jgi:hypothetical protein
MLECASAELPMAIEPAQPFSERNEQASVLDQMDSISRMPSVQH